MPLGIGLLLDTVSKYVNNFIDGNILILVGIQLHMWLHVPFYFTVSNVCCSPQDLNKLTEN